MSALQTHSVWKRICLPVFVGLMILPFCACGEDPDIIDTSCTRPSPSDVDTFYGEYVFTFFNPNAIRRTQQSFFLFRTNGKFFIRVDTTVAMPARSFNDASADYVFARGGLELTNVLRNPASGGFPDVPEGTFEISCKGDSLILYRESTPAPPDTTMRIAFRIP